MAKDPAFLFYSSDFLTGVSDLTFEERGQYITLLCLEHQKGRLTKKAIGIAVPNATADVLAKFSIDEKGRFFNRRLEEESQKRKQHSEKQRQRALDGWKKRKNSDATANATALPLENEDDNEDINKGGVGEKDFSINESHSLRIVNHQNEHQTWIETLYRNFKLANKKLGVALKDFNDSLIKYDTVHTNISEYKRHFINWMHTQESKGNLTHLKK